MLNFLNIKQENNRPTYWKTNNNVQKGSKLLHGGWGFATDPTMDAYCAPLVSHFGSSLLLTPNPTPELRVLVFHSSQLVLLTYCWIRDRQSLLTLLLSGRGHARRCFFLVSFRVENLTNLPKFHIYHGMIVMFVNYTIADRPQLVIQ